MIVRVSLDPHAYLLANNVKNEFEKVKLKEKNFALQIKKSEMLSEILKQKLKLWKVLKL